MAVNDLIVNQAATILNAIMQQANIGGDLAVLQRRQHSGAVHQPAPGKIQHPHAVLHRGYRVVVNHVVILVGQRTVERDYIALGIDFLRSYELGVHAI